MTRVEFNYIKDAFSQIIDDIAGNPDWYEAAKAVASDLGTLERKLEEKISSLPSNLDEAAVVSANTVFHITYEDDFDDPCISASSTIKQNHNGFIKGFKAGAEWMAGQGYVDEVKHSNLEDRKYVFVPYEEFNPGDKVVVQIRKK